MKNTNESLNKFLLSILISLGLTILTLGLYVLISIYNNNSFGGLKNFRPDRENLIAMQIIMQVMFFCLTPFIYSLLTKQNFYIETGLKLLPTIKEIIISIIVALALFPVMSFLQEIMIDLPWPNYIKKIAESQKLIQETEMKIFLTFSNFISLLVLIFVIGIMAGISEEMFFRAGIFKIFKNKYNLQIGILISSVVFALIHMSIYQIFPILIIAILFAYIYHITGKIWINIIIHSLYNSFQVVLYYLFESKKIGYNINNYDEINIIQALLGLGISIVGFFIILKPYYLKK